MSSETDIASCLKLEHSSLDHEVGDQEVYEAEDGLVLHVSHTGTQQKETVSL